MYSPKHFSFDVTLLLLPAAASLAAGPRDRGTRSVGGTRGFLFLPDGAVVGSDQATSSHSKVEDQVQRSKPGLQILGSCKSSKLKAQVSIEGK